MLKGYEIPPYHQGAKMVPPKPSSKPVAAPVAGAASPVVANNDVLAKESDGALSEEEVADLIVDQADYVDERKTKDPRYKNKGIRGRMHFAAQNDSFIEYKV